MQNLHRINEKEKRDIFVNLMRVLNGQLDHIGLRIVEVFDEHQEGVAYVTLVGASSLPLIKFDFS